jgi:hypothetical protein
MPPNRGFRPSHTPRRAHRLIGRAWLARSGTSGDAARIRECDGRALVPVRPLDPLGAARTLQDNCNRLWDMRTSRQYKRFKGHQNTSKNFVRAHFMGPSNGKSDPPHGPHPYPWATPRGLRASWGSRGE